MMELIQYNIPGYDPIMRFTNLDGAREFEAYVTPSQSEFKPGLKSTRGDARMTGEEAEYAQNMDPLIDNSIKESNTTESGLLSFRIRLEVNDFALRKNY